MSTFLNGCDVRSSTDDTLGLIVHKRRQPGRLYRSTRQSLSTKLIFIRTRYSVIFPFFATTS
jgi:hypothetical protein